VPYGRNVRGAGAWRTGLATCRLKCLVKQVSL